MDRYSRIGRSWRLPVLIVGFVLLSSMPVSAQMDYQADLDFKTGWRMDELDWTIAGFLTADRFVNVLSELQWDDVQSYQAQLGYRASLGIEDRRIRSYLRLEGGYGWIYSGENQDSDFAGSNRTLEFSRSNNQADKGDVVDLSGGIGVQIRSHDDHVRIMPMAGYAYHEQDLVLTDGFQSISDQSIIDSIFGPGQILLQPEGPFPGLNSDYEAHWEGPWLGSDLEVRGEDWSFLFGAEIHFMDYEAEARWNLRRDLAQPVSFEHEADGYGVVLSGRSTFALSGRWHLLAEARYRDFWTDAGVDRVFAVNNSGQVTVSETRLNEVNWSSLGGSIGIVYRFN